MSKKKVAKVGVIAAPGTDNKGVGVGVPPVAKSGPVKSDFTLVAEKMPETKKHSEVVSRSQPLLLKLASGKVVQGLLHIWEREMNAPHIQAKKGDSFFQTLGNELLTDVVGWKKI